MLRTILRNVQYYFLFVTIILVLLAFQRLQWLDQGLLAHPYALLDRPMHGMRGFTPSSPDSAGRVYYGGDESKEIGLFKFKLGLFKFVLPTFAHDDASWERTNELSSFTMVPPPPNKRRNSAENMYSRLKAQNQMHSKNKKGKRDEGSTGKESPKSSVAYVVVVPDLSNKHDDDAVHSYHQRVKVLSESVRQAHMDSPYEYRLYALNLNGASVVSMDADRGDTKQKEVDEMFVQSRFDIVNVNEDELNNISETMSMDLDGRPKNAEQHDLLKLLNKHDVTVQICLNSFLLQPMDELFDVLLKGGNSERVIGVNNINKGDQKGGRPADEANQSGPESAKIDAFMVTPSPGSSNLVIFQSSSQQATKSYVKRLECISSLQSMERKQLSHEDVSTNNRPKLPIMVARKNLQINPDHAKTDAEHCRMQVDNSLQLDRCIYDAGISHDVGHGCTLDRMRGGARVAHIREETAAEAASRASAALETEGPDNLPVKKNDGSECGKPWEYSRKDCSKNSESICTWLCDQWYHFVK
mmetsp:Transcript_38271/g.92324  ORF Transcript_38271/g.92324 Transcript_38271/m.92324 type:complete len:527 (+) Transcript_38271:96-1676(+)